MLRVKSVKNITPINILIDEYIPLKIVFGDYAQSVEPTIYWYTGDFKKNYIEIGFGKENGIIRSITLLIINDIKKDEVKIDCDRFVIGLPVFERITFDESSLYVKEEGPLKMIIDNNNVYIFISENKICSKIICGQISFFLDADNYFCGFVVESLSDKEIRGIEDTIQFKLSYKN